MSGSAAASSAMARRSVRSPFCERGGYNSKEMVGRSRGTRKRLAVLIGCTRRQMPAAYLLHRSWREHPSRGRLPLGVAAASWSRVSRPLLMVGIHCTGRGAPAPWELRPSHFLDTRPQIGDRLGVIPVDDRARPAAANRRVLRLHRLAYDVPSNPGGPGWQ